MAIRSLWCSRIPLVASLTLLFSITSGNQTAKENQVVILVCLDGLGWQNVTSQTMPNLIRVANSGVRAKYIKPASPTFTWPILHSYMTGLHPESHGIVSNVFWDPVYKEKFIFDYDCSNYDPKYYNLSEPIWLSVQKQGGRSAVHFWPGYYSYPEKPTFHEKPVCYLNCSEVSSQELPKMRKRTRPGWPPYLHSWPNYSEPIRARVDKVISWLQSDNPPQFVALYSHQPDKAGHNYGVTSKQYKEAMKHMDTDLVGYLMESLQKVELLQNTNLLFVSDHGLVDVSSSRQVYLEDFIDPKSYWMTSSLSSGHVWPREGKADEIYRNLSQAKNPHLKVYKKDNIPDHLHWKHNRRVPPIWIEPDVGWIVSKYRSAHTKKWSFGAHGWSADSPELWSFFVASGPGFREGYEAGSFNNVDLYPLMCHLLGIEPQPNNGSLENVKAILKEKVKLTRLTV